MGPPRGFSGRRPPAACGLDLNTGDRDGSVAGDRIVVVDDVIVERMAVLDEDFGPDPTLVEGNGGIRSCPVSVPERTPRDLRSLYDREHARADRERARADAAEAHAEELRWAEVASRTDAEC